MKRRHFSQFHIFALKQFHASIAFPVLFALIFDSVSGGEWIVLLAVVLIVAGPQNLPSMARRIGKVTSSLRKCADSFWRAIMTLDEPPDSSTPEIPEDDASPHAPPSDSPEFPA